MSTSFKDAHIRKLLTSRPKNAVALLHEKFSSGLIAIADRHTRNRLDSEDVVQEVFADVLKRHKEIGGMSDEPIERYLIKAVRYRAIAHYKRKVRAAVRGARYFEIYTETGVSYAPDRHLISLEQETFFGWLIAALSPREKESLLMQFEGAPVKDIAFRLSISVKAVERNLTRAKKRLRRLYGREL